MFYRLDLQSHGTLVILYVLQFHVQETDLPLEALHGINFIGCLSRISLMHLNLCLKTVFLLFSQRKQISQSDGICFSQLKPDIMKQKDQNLDICL